jgi:small subunit ribosomal protein S8
VPPTDPIADMLTRVRNAVQARHQTVTMPSSKTKASIAKILESEGFISGYEVIEKKPQNDLRLDIRYYENRSPVISGLKRVSRPGLRVYVGHNEIPRYYGGLGVALISSSNGIITGRDAWRQGVGGELLLYLW